MDHQPPDQARAETVSTKALTHYAMLTLHRRVGSRRVAGIRNTVAELSISIARAMFADGAIRLDDVWATNSSPLIYWDVDGLPGMCIFHTLFLIPKQYSLLGPLDGQEQLLDILQSFFRNAATYYPETVDTGSTTYFSRVGLDFITESAHALSNLIPSSLLFSRHTILLQTLASRLRDLHDDLEARPPSDYMFFATFAYVFELLFNRSDIIETETGRDLILAIIQYRERVNPQQDEFYTSYDGVWNYDTDWPYFLSRVRDIVTVVPGSMQEPPPVERAEMQEGSDQPSGGAVVEVLHHHASFLPDEGYFSAYRAWT